MVHHVANEHVCSGDLVIRCSPGPLDHEVARKKKWLQKGSKAHNALKEVVLDKRLIKDICQLSVFCHTGSLEVYRSLMTKYVPKLHEFDFDQMLERTASAVIDHNMSRSRAQPTNKKGEKQFRLVYPKATSEWGWLSQIMRRSHMIGSFQCYRRLVGYFGFNAPLRRYFSLYRAVSLRRRKLVGWLFWI